MGEVTKAKSPLLPLRHDADLFVCDVFDAPIKSDPASMEHPIFTLSKKPDMKIRRYENGPNWAEIRPSTKGLATVFDRDILIYCISQLMKAVNEGRPVSQTLRIKAYDLLVATNRDVNAGGRSYALLKDALERLRGTTIVTNIKQGNGDAHSVFGIVDSAGIVRESLDGRMQEITIKLSDWLYDAVASQEVLTLDRRYFQLSKPLERRLYELARKHVGAQSEFRIGLEKLRLKTGSQSTAKEFRRLINSVIADDAKHNHIPGYSFALDDEIVVMRPKPDATDCLAPTLPKKRLELSPDIYEEARTLARGWDIQVLESEWREWVSKKGIVPRNADKHFLAFCKQRGPYGASR
ncbi:MAG: replication initiator protein A [Burkholderiaceae bacterium]